MALAYAIPRIESQIITNGGTMSRDWYLFFSALLQTVGGPDVVPGGGIPPIDVQQQFEEYAITSTEAVEALRGVAELRSQVDHRESASIHALETAIEELRCELVAVRNSNDQLRAQLDEQASRILDVPTNELRNRVEAIEGRLA